MSIDRTHVLYFATQPTPIPRQILGAEALTSGGYHVDFLLWDRFGEFKRDDAYNEFAIKRITTRLTARNQKLPIDNRWWGVPGKRGVRIGYALPELYVRVLYELLQMRWDVLHCCHFAILPIALAAAKSLRRRVVYEVSEDYVYQGFTDALGWKRLSRIAYAIELAMAKKVDAVVCVPSVEDRLAERYRRVNRRVLTVRNYPKKRGSCKPRRADNKIDKVAVYLGGIQQIKDFDIVLNAIREVVDVEPQFRMVFVGKSHGDDSKVIEEFSRAHGLSKNIEVRPSVPYEKVSEALACASVGIVLMDRRYVLKNTVGNSRKILEYMKAGLAIVTPDYGNASDVVREENCGIVLSRNSSIEMAESILTLLREKKTRHGMSKRGYAAFESKYSWEQEGRRLVSHYDWVMQTPGVATQ